MPIAPGTRIGNYEIQAPLGEGGMGAVYQAHDPTLQRTVAIKVLAKQDADASARLLQEARAASALNHPHICTVYEVGEHEGQAFIVMEHVEGKPLSALIPADGLPPESVIRYGTQIADALAHAHERGIVHRDLKSQNVVITPEGRAKVLDFGLAARMPQADAEAVTKTQEALPHAGMLVGTLAYMAPEVLRGEAATARSDIWALGVLLYEMASGRLPFEGETALDVTSAIAKESPRALPSRVSAGLRSVVQRCLQKEPGSRYSAVVAVQAALETIQSDTGTQQASIVPVGATRTGRVAAAVIGLVLVAGSIGYWLRPGDEGVTTSAPRLTNPRQLTRVVGVEDFPTVSPSGDMVAYHSINYDQNFYGPERGDIWVSRVGEGEPINRTEDSPGLDITPSWSPDGEQIAFVSDRLGGEPSGGGSIESRVFVMPVLAGPARQVSPLVANPDSRPVWSPDGTELAFTTVADDRTPRISITSLETGSVAHIRLDNLQGMGPNGFSNLSWSPDGRFFAYNEGHDGNQARVLWVVRRTDGVAFRISDDEQDDGSPSWSPDSRAVYFVSNRGGSRDLWQQRLAEDGEPVGAAQAVTAGIGMRHAAMAPDGRTLTYSRGGRVSYVWRIPILDERQATWADAEQITFDEAFIEHFDVSSDGERLALSSERAGNPRHLGSARKRRGDATAHHRHCRRLCSAVVPRRPAAGLLLRSQRESGYLDRIGQWWSRTTADHRRWDRSVSGLVS